jgi:hypothetical protein
MTEMLILIKAFIKKLELAPSVREVAREGIGGIPCPRFLCNFVGEQIEPKP